MAPLRLRASLAPSKLRAMKPLRVAVTVVLSLLPAVAMACPSASACGSCSASGAGPYFAALGVGLLAGMGSIRLEGLLRRGRNNK